MLDSVVQADLADADLGADAPFRERSIGLVRGYKRDLDQNRARCARCDGSLRRECVVTTSQDLRCVLQEDVRSPWFHATMEGPAMASLQARHSPFAAHWTTFAESRASCSERHSPSMAASARKG